MSLVFKTVILTFFATISILFSGIMLAAQAGWFVVVSAASYASMAASHAAMSKVKQLNGQRKSRVVQKTTKRAGKRIAATSLGASIPIISVPIVAAATTGFLIEDHCDELTAINEVETVIDGAESYFDLTLCLDETTELAKSWANEAFEYGRDKREEIISDLYSQLESMKGKLPF